MSFESVVSLPPSLDRRPRLLTAAMAWGAEIAQYFIDEASSLIKGVNMKSMFAAYVEDQVEGALWAHYRYVQGMSETRCDDRGRQNDILTMKKDHGQIHEDCFKGKYSLACFFTRSRSGSNVRTSTYRLSMGDFNRDLLFHSRIHGGVCFGLAGGRRWD